MRTQPMQHQAAASPALPKSESGRDKARDLIAALRARIDATQRTAHRFARQRTPATPWTLRLASIDACLPASGLARAALHDISPAHYGDFPAAAGFALALAIERLSDPAERRPLLWCRLQSEVSEYGRTYGHGLERLGLPRARFLTVTLKKPVSLFWTMEEALKSGCLALVIGDAASRRTDLTTTRRLALAAEAGKSAGLLVFTHDHVDATASHTRWRVKATRSQAPPFDPAAPGTPAWDIELTRARSGRPGSWTVTWHPHHATHRFHLVPGFLRGALPARPEEGGRIAAA